MTRSNGMYYIHGKAFATREQALIYLYCQVMNNPNHLHSVKEA